MPEVSTESMDIVDLNDFDLEELLSLDNPAITSSLARVLQEDDESSGIIAGFQSAI